MRKMLTFCCSICLTACSSLHAPAPNVYPHSIGTRSALNGKAEGRAWQLENLKPDEGTIFIDGRTIPVSIDLKVSGNGHYALALSATNEKFRPFLLQTDQGAGTMNFSGTITWYYDVSGTSDTVQMALYEVDESESGETEIKTLLKHFRRKYQVVCDKDQFFLILMLKRLFGLCNYAPTE